MLGLDRASAPSQLDIRRAYRRQSLKVHPDLHPDDPHAHTKFMRIRAAYDALIATDTSSSQPDVRDSRETFRVDLEQRERLLSSMQGRVTPTVDEYRRQNRAAIEELTRRWERERAALIKIPRLDTLDECIAFSMKLTPKEHAELKRHNRQHVASLVHQVNEAIQVNKQ